MKILVILFGEKGIAVRFKKIRVLSLFFLFFFHSIGFANGQKEVIVFVSFSMPEFALKTWMKEASTYDASVNIRGLIGNNFPVTIQTIQKLVKEDNNQGGINIDPVLFETYGVDKIPAVVVRQMPNQAFDVVYGTSSIREALQIMEAAA